MGRSILLPVITNHDHSVTGPPNGRTATSVIVPAFLASIRPKFNTPERIPLPEDVLNHPVCEPSEDVEVPFVERTLLGCFSVPFSSVALRRPLSRHCSLFVYP
jgi:hypothetical protein